MRMTNFLRDAFIKQAMADVPSVDYVELIRKELMKIALDRLPAKVRAVADDPECSMYVKKSYAYAGDTHAEVPAYEWRASATANQPHLETLVQKKNEQDKVRRALESKLRTVVYSVNTNKALLEMLPEFEKYIPKEADKTTYPVAVTGLVTDFMAAGWPKNKPQPQLQPKSKPKTAK